MFSLSLSIVAKGKSGRLKLLHLVARGNSALEVRYVAQSSGMFSLEVLHVGESYRVGAQERPLTQSMALR